MKNSYLPILTETTRKTFFDYINFLNISQINYFAIGVQNVIAKKSISLMSRPEWQKHFVTNQYAEHDPVRRATLLTKRNLMPFNEIDFIDSFGKEIMRQRILMGIKNGIVLMERFENFNYMITLGTDYSKFNAYEFIKSYHDKISILKKDLIQLIEKDAYKFLPRGMWNQARINHLFCDAK